MSNKSNPNVLRCAKQVYTNLQLKERSKLLESNSMSPEVIKLETLFSLTDKPTLDKLIRSFFSWTPPTHRRKNLQDFILMLDKEIDIHTITKADFSVTDFGDDILEELEFGEDFNDDCFDTVEPQSKKRASSLENEGGKPKKLKISLPLPVPATLSTASTPSAQECFREDTSNSADSNIICSPASGVKLFTNIPYITLYEIARFLQCCKVSWDQIPFDAFQMFLNTANNEPRKLYDVMMHWNQEVRLGLKLNGLAFTSMERCPENVYAYIKRQEKEMEQAATTITAKQVMTMSPVSPAPASVETKKASKLKNRMIHYSGMIQFKISSSPPSITLRSPKIEASNRLFRKFGHDRFLELKLAKSSSPFLIRKHKDYFLKPFLLMHRVFRFLFVKDDTVILFATEGIGLEPMTIQQVIDWHMPITENWSMTMSKYASRMSLGYSSSIPTLLFKPDEIRYVDDIYANGISSDETLCMTDGCGIISPSAMKLIMGCQATDELPCAIQGRIAGAKGIWIIAPDLDFSSGNYIEIRKSQDKFKTGVPQEDLGLDPLHYTFDLVKNSICVYPSNLNTQFIQSLSAGGVPTEVFIEILKEYIHRLADIVTENQNVKILRDWVAKTGNIMNSRWESEENTEKDLWHDIASGEDENDSGIFSMAPLSPQNGNRLHDDDEENFANSTGLDGKVSTDYSALQADYEAKKSSYNKINKHSGFPAGLHESIVRLLDSGFDLSNAYIATRVTMVFRQVMQSITIKYKIEVPQSCTVTCVPDPTNTLEPGEVFLQLSSRKKDEKTGIRAGQILGDVIVTRNPCGLKSDIQKVKAVDCTALRMYTDIIIFSVKGDVSLASQLSGGDYDGDIVFCCWDERIVNPFKPSPVPTESDRVQKAFQKDKATLGQEIGAHINAEHAIQNSFISVTLPDGTLGVYENWRTVLAELRSLDDPDVIYLAHMCAKLVDAPKQGLRLTATTSSRDRSNFSKIAHPAWFMDKKNKQRDANIRSYKQVNEVYTIHDAPCVTTMDHLYDTLLKETAAFTKYSRSLFCDDDVPFKDSDLTAPWLKALQNAHRIGGKDLMDDLDLIAKAIRLNKEAYTKQCGEFHSQRAHFMDNIRNPSRYTENKFVDELQSRFNNYLELEEYFAKDFIDTPDPLLYKSAIVKFDMEANNGKMIQILKASYAYTLSITADKYNKYCYIVAYDVLRRIKADACALLVKENGLGESVSVSTYKAFNLDRKTLKRIKETSYVEKGVEKVRLLPDLAPQK